MPKTQSVQNILSDLKGIPPSQKEKVSVEEFSFFGIKLNCRKSFGRVSKSKIPIAKDDQKELSSLINSFMNQNRMSQPLAETIEKKAPFYRSRSRRKGHSVTLREDLSLMEEDNKFSISSLSTQRSKLLHSSNDLPIQTVDEPKSKSKPDAVSVTRNLASMAATRTREDFWSVSDFQKNDQISRTSFSSARLTEKSQEASDFLQKKNFEKMRETNLVLPRKRTQEIRPATTENQPKKPIRKKNQKNQEIPFLTMTEPVDSVPNSVFFRKNLMEKDKREKLFNARIPKHSDFITENNPDAKIHENLTKIRNGWMKTAKSLENSYWTVGDQQTHHRRVEKYFIDAQAETRHCDVVIQTADGRNLYAHSLVLASHSKAFEKRLLSMNPGTGVPKIYRLRLTKKVSGTMVAKVVDWMYKGFTRISADSLPELTKVAQYFHIAPLVAECLHRKLVLDSAHELAERETKSPSVSSSDYESEAHERLRFKSGKTATTAPPVDPPKKPYRTVNRPPTTAPPAEPPEKPYRIVNQLSVKNGRNPETGAGDDSIVRSTTGQSPDCGLLPVQSYPVNDLALSASTSTKKFDGDNFESLSLEDPNTFDLAKKIPVEDVHLSIVSMTAGQLEEFLSDDDLEIQSELEVLDTVMSWIAVAPAQREIYTHQLFSCVRFHQISNEELKICFKFHPNYFQSLLFRKFLADAFRAKALMVATANATDLDNRDVNGHRDRDRQLFPVDFTVLPNRCRVLNKNKNSSFYLISHTLRIAILR